MANTPAKWVFKQLGGNRRVLELSGYNAPFGRPRQGEVVNEEQELRDVETYYPDSQEGPTIHLFGTKWNDWEIHGRFRDKFNGEGGALDKHRECKAFFRDQQQCAISWHDVVGVSGYIRKYGGRIEADREIAWSMTIRVYADDYAEQRPVVQPRKKPPALVNGLLEAFGDGAIFDEIREIPPSLHPNLFDALSSLVNSVTSFTGSIRNIANQIDSFERATIGEVKRFRAGIEQLRESLVQLDTVYQNFRADVVVEQRAAEDDQRLLDVQSAFGASMVEALARTNDADRQAKIAERGKIKGTHVAKQGETWEQMSQAEYGTTDRAVDIQISNGTKAGAKPVPGTQYQLPA